MDMYKKAAQLKLRYNTSQGMVNTEDLRNLPLPTLDILAIQCQKEAKKKEISFIKDVEPVDEVAVLRFEIVKDVISDLLAEAKARTDAAGRCEKKQKILAALEAKDDEALNSMSRSKLLKMFAEMDD